MADRLLGSFVWCELLTTDTAAAESFYKKVVGWTSAPFGPGGYIVFNNSAGSGVGGVMKLPDQAKQMGAPPHWMMYVGTPDVDGMAVRIAQMGGRVLKQPDDIPTVGRFAVVQDPYGASFAIFTPKPAPGSPERKKGATGEFSWFELYTPNPEGAWKFYETLFGWEKTSAMDMGEMGVYQMFGRGGGIPNGGIMKPPPGAPAAWMPYALVKDAKAAAAAATANGGKIVNGPMEVPGGDWIAQGMDPQGAMFSVHSLKPAAQRAASAKKAAPSKKTAKKAKKASKKKSAAKKTKARPVKKSAKPAKKKKSTRPTKKKAKKAAKRKK
jgi:predicted enzyme related to lactoylglutathione lyase